MWLNGKIGVLTLVSIVSMFDYCTVVIWENVLNLKKFTLRFLGVTGRDLPFYCQMVQKKCFKIDGWTEKERIANQEQMGKNVVGESEERVGVFLAIFCTILATFLCLKLFPNKTFNK